MLTLAMSVSTYLTGWGIDQAGLSPRRMAILLGVAFMIPGIGWLLLQRWLDNQDSGFGIQDSGNPQSHPAALSPEPQIPNPESWLIKSQEQSHTAFKEVDE